ncbi:hypothetical protein D7S76_25765 [Ralstonia pickettii]|nr:hypothetical protein [Ralstonia insidiosa]MBA9926842.1 hypothetical protein [Ralstonia pickettii]
MFEAAENDAFGLSSMLKQLLKPSRHGALVDTLRKECVWIVRSISQAGNYLINLRGPILQLACHSESDKQRPIVFGQAVDCW